jgi:hypothetical protein
MIMRWLALGALLLFGTAAQARGDDSVECRSRNYQYTECEADFRRPQLVQQLSDSDCTEGDSWGYNRRRGAIWVSKGCGGLFADGDERYGRRDRDRDDDDRSDRRRDRDDDDDRSDRRRGRGRETIECRSSGYAFTRCDVEWSEARLIEQLSDSECIEGRTWGVDRHGLWVDKGCGGRFSGR